MDSLKLFPTCNVNVNIGIASIQRWRARQLVEGWHLYRAVPGASSWLTANSLERRLDCSWCPVPVEVTDHCNRTLSVLGGHATGGANPRRNTNTDSVRLTTAGMMLMRHSVSPNAGGQAAAACGGSPAP